jgi:hypothetical protein
MYIRFVRVVSLQSLARGTHGLHLSRLRDEGVVRFTCEPFNIKMRTSQFAEYIAPGSLCIPDVK